ncbi:hypothetical protein G6F62_015277 [Rhizopus arrhizus]|nr:hypothetical protein G6F62_015277 [Rhizopus arrhizus]
MRERLPAGRAAAMALAGAAARIADGNASGRRATNRATHCSASSSDTLLTSSTVMADAPEAGSTSIVVRCLSS